MCKALGSIPSSAEKKIFFEESHFFNQLGMVVHACNSSTQEAEAGRS
jgi:hypothetical protein